MIYGAWPGVSVGAKSAHCLRGPRPENELAGTTGFAGSRDMGSAGTTSMTS